MSDKEDEIRAEKIAPQTFFTCGKPEFDYTCPKAPMAILWAPSWKWPVDETQPLNKKMEFKNDSTGLK